LGINRWNMQTPNNNNSYFCSPFFAGGHMRRPSGNGISHVAFARKRDLLEAQRTMKRFQIEF